jgi:hypothetical protein
MIKNMDQSKEESASPINPFKRNNKVKSPPEQLASPEDAVDPTQRLGHKAVEAHDVETDGLIAQNYITSNEADEINLGKELAKSFKDKNVHPVFIFGAKGSGKSSLIASILRYMRDREEAAASIELAESIFPEGDQWWVDSIEWSRDLFYKKVFAYVDNKAPEATQEAQPFFVPVKVTRKSGEEIYFAFLEGKGEWYQPDFSTNVPFRKFKGFLQGVLQNYNDKATVIYVAPFVTGSSFEPANSPYLRNSDIGLLGALEEYLSIRRAFAHQDQHMFLVTKWDVFCGSIASPSFIDPLGDEIQVVLRERYPLAWTRFLNSNFSGVIQNKDYSAFCSGLIDGTTIVSAAEEDDANVSFYARKLWDWLHENAVGGILYQDVRPKELTKVDKVLKWLRG